MSIIPVSFTGTTNSQRRCPIELLDDALHALERNDPHLADTCIRQLPPSISKQIFHRVWEAHGRPMDRGDHFGEEAFFGLNHHPCDTELKKAILEQVIEERSNQLQAAFREQDTPAPSPNFFARITSGMTRALISLTMQPTARSQTREERLMTHIQSANTPLIPVLVRIVAVYTGIIERFGAEEWRHYFQVDVGPEPELPDDFYTFWDGPDPLDPTQRVSDTHLPPVLRPAHVTLPGTNEQRTFELELLNHLAQHPRLGERQSQYKTGLIERIVGSTAPTAVGLAVWLVKRRGIVGRNQFFYYLEELEFIHDVNRRTGSFYVPKPSILDLSTVIFTRYVATGERHLGDATGTEQQTTYSFTASTTFTQCDIAPIVIGNFATGFRGNAVLDHYGTFDTNHNAGIALLYPFGAAAQMNQPFQQIR